MKTPPNPWLISPWMDGLFIIAAPLAILPAYHTLSLLLPLSVLAFAVLVVSATGHHLPGFIRAYTDPDTFRRFRGRLLVVPALIVLLAAGAAWYKLSLIFLLLIVWGTWHGLMQVHGFLRIYDAKAGIHFGRAARLDYWMCLTWFVQVILWSSGKKMSVLSTFYLSGGPLLSARWMGAFETAWLGLTVAVTAAYVVTTALDARRGVFNPLKLATLAVSIAFWAYCMLTVDNIIVGLLLWEIFHDIQYNTFVWSYNAGRVERGLSRSRIERFLFRKNRGRIVLYASCIVAYGFLGFFGQDLVNAYRNGETHGNLWQRVGNIFAASALTHFYLDGFIWKVRDAKVRQDLGMAVAAAEPRRNFAAARHWAFVTVVFAASFGLAASEHFHWTRTRREQMHGNLAELVPGSAYAHFMHASELKTQGRMEAARNHYLKAMALDNDYRFAHALVADLEVRLGDTASAIGSYERALALDPSDPLIVGNLADLYQSAGRLEEAARLFQTLITLEPANAQAHYALAFTLLRLKRGLDAKPHLERTLALDSAQPAALNYLGMVEHALGNTARARMLYEAALIRSPDYGHARDNLAALSSTASATSTKKAP